MATKTAQIIALREKHPEWTHQQIADAVKPKSTIATVSNLLSTKGLSKRSKGKPTTSNEEVYQFCLRVGGIDEALKLLGKLGENPVLKFAANAGGLENAVAKVNAIKEKLAK